MAASIFDRIGAIADATRARLLLLIEDRELTVGELCAVLQLPQSTVSRHLKVLVEEGWATSRADGTSRWYRLATSLPPEVAGVWSAVRAQAAAVVEAAEDAARLRSVLAARRSRSREFFSSAAGEWDALRAELFGERPDLAALPGLLDREWTVGDLGCGTGPLAASVAPFVRRVVAVDESAEMLEAAQSRLNPLGLGNVELRRGSLEELPVGDAELDAAVLSLVLPYVAEPPRVLGEAVRALRPGGRLLVVDMMPHGREEYRERMGHVWLGFAAGPMTTWLEQAGLEAVRYIPLAADPRGKGPRLFAGVGRKAA